MNHSLKPWNTLAFDTVNAGTLYVPKTNNNYSMPGSMQPQKDNPLLSVKEVMYFFWKTIAGTGDHQPDQKVSKFMMNLMRGIYMSGARKLASPGGVRLQEGMPGLENLALIPGCVGSSPIQNIGAYGVELQRVCAYVDCVELATGKQVRLTAKECRFGYRDSIFKHEYQDRFAIVAVGLRLPKEWQPVLTYGDLTRLDPTTVTPQQVFNAVCHMRTTKLPDPKVNGNAGSFFKNPVVSAETAEALLSQFPTAPNYPQADGSVNRQRLAYLISAS